MLSQTCFFTIFFSVVNLPYEEKGDPWWRSLRKLAAHEQELSESPLLHRNRTDADYFTFYHPAFHTTAPKRADLSHLKFTKKHN